MSALPIGFGMGLLVAAQPGPMSLLLIRCVLRGSVHTGLAIGAGIAVVDTLYAALARRLVGERLLRAVDAAAGTGLLGFAGALG
jgi:putative LysE/RhtB family amino acid efflux pump